MGCKTQWNFNIQPQRMKLPVKSVRCNLWDANRYETSAANSNDLPKWQCNFTKYCACHEKWHCAPPILHLPPKVHSTSYNVAKYCACHTDPEPRMNLSVRGPPVCRGYLSRFGEAFCIEKCNVAGSGYHSKFDQILRAPRKVAAQLHQIVRLPWNVPFRHHCNLQKSPRQEKWCCNFLKFCTCHEQ